MFECNDIVTSVPPHLSYTTVKEFTVDVVVLVGHSVPPPLDATTHLQRSAQSEWLMRYCDNVEDIGSAQMVAGLQVGH